MNFEDKQIRIYNVDKLIWIEGVFIPFNNDNMKNKIDSSIRIVQYDKDNKGEIEYFDKNNFNKKFDSIDWLQDFLLEATNDFVKLKEELKLKEENEKKILEEQKRAEEEEREKEFKLYYNKAVNFKQHTLCLGYKKKGEYIEPYSQDKSEGRGIPYFIWNDGSDQDGEIDTIFDADSDNPIHFKKLTLYDVHDRTHRDIRMIVNVPGFYLSYNPIASYYEYKRSAEDGDVIRRDYIGGFDGKVYDKDINYLFGKYGVIIPLDGPILVNDKKINFLSCASIESEKYYDIKLNGSKRFLVVLYKNIEETFNKNEIDELSNNLIPRPSGSVEAL